MTDKKTEALKLALSVLNEVRSETFRLLRNGQTLYAEEKVWNAVFVIKQALAQPLSDDEQPALDEDQTHYKKVIDDVQALFEAKREQPELASASVEPVALDPKDVHVEVVTKQMGGFSPVMTNGIRLTHKPTGTVVEETAERSAHRNRDAAWKKLSKLVTSPPANANAGKPLTDEGTPLYASPLTQQEPEPVSNADELPKGFVPLEQENGKIIYAACLDPNARHYRWLMWKHPDGQWVSRRKLEGWEVMQAEDQSYYGIILGTAAHGITGVQK
jgi:hypothetical protein